MLVYRQSSGTLTDAKGVIRCLCYSGKGEHKNDPKSEFIRDYGPIPKGFYVMQPPQDSKEHGPAAIWLQPVPTNEMHGRSGFGMHSDSVSHPGDASEGCIVNTRVSGEPTTPTSVFRRKLFAEGDFLIQVVE